METLNFVETQIERSGDTDYLYTARTSIGRFTVLDRMTGFGWRGIESGFKDLNGDFYLVEGEDIRQIRIQNLVNLAEWFKQHYTSLKKNGH